jgi:hypothetical protein
VKLSFVYKVWTIQKEAVLHYPLSKEHQSLEVSESVGGDMYSTNQSSIVTAFQEGTEVTRATRTFVPCTIARSIQTTVVMLNFDGWLLIIQIHAIHHKIFDHLACVCFSRLHVMGQILLVAILQIFPELALLDNLYPFAKGSSQHASHDFPNGSKPTETSQ